MTYTGQEILDWVIAIVGNLFLIVLVVKALQYFAKAEWGEFIGLLIAGVLLGSFIWMPEQTTAFFRYIAGLFFA